MPHGSVSHLYVIMLPWILVTRLQHIYLFTNWNYINWPILCGTVTSPVLGNKIVVLTDIRTLQQINEVRIISRISFVFGSLT
jgi:hypothetical protein